MTCLAMKKIILLILLGVSLSGYAQTGTLYFSLTPQEGVQPQNQTEGIYKSVYNANSPLYTSPSIFFYLESKARDIRIKFAQINYNKSELARRNLVQEWNDEMEIITVGNNIVSSHTVYNLDSFFRAKSKKELIDWFESLDVRNKKIYFFDQRDYDKGKLTLIQVKLLDYGSRMGNDVEYIDGPFPE